MAGFNYDDSPLRLDEYVTIDELDGLLQDEGRQLLKQQKRLIHFLTRLRNTMLAFRQQIQSLHRDVQAANIRATSIGAPTSLDPRSAAKFLPPEELASLADELIKEKLVALKSLEEENSTRRADLLKKAASLKFALSTIMEDYSISQEVRDKISNAFSNPLAQLESLAQEEPLPQSNPAGSLVQPTQHPNFEQPPRSELDDLFN